MEAFIQSPRLVRARSLSCWFGLMAGMSVFPASAFEPEETLEPGFSGYIQLAVVAMENTSLSAVSDENERISRLDQNADSDSAGTAAIFWELNYTLDNQQTQFYMGTPEQNLIEANPLFEVGVRHQFNDGTLITGAFLPRIPGVDEVWEDPYLTNADRKETDSSMQGAYLSAAYLFGGPVSVRYVYASLEVDDEASGASLLNQVNGLTAEEVKTLRRDADFHQTEVSLTLPFSARMYLIPEVYYTLADAEGDAFDFDRYGGELFLFFCPDGLEISTGVSYEQSEYDQSHPVFDKTREDKAVSATASIGVLQPFGWEPIRMDAVFSYSETDSNIEFYDQEGSLGALGVTYSF